MSNVDALMDVIASARGARPASLACPEAEDGMTISIALLVELAVANDRIDRLERMVAELRGMTPEALRETAPTPAEAEERREANEALIVRVLHILFDPRKRIDGPAERAGAPPA